jgi:hypothetical protein
LSAVLNERDVVAYQTGRWLVDGVVVGDTDTSISPTLRYCYIDTIQVVWTHNCEHGVLRGIELVPQSSIDASTDSTKRNENGVIVLQSTGEMIEFGPEQLVARIPVDWMPAVVGSDDDDGPIEQCVTLAPVMHDEWLTCD